MSVREDLAGQAADVLAKLRFARRFDRVCDVMDAEIRLNWLIDQLAPPPGWTSVWSSPALDGRGQLSAMALPVRRRFVPHLF